MGYDNWGRQYNSVTRKTTYKFINSEEYIITEVGEEQIKQVFLDGKLLNVKYRDITVKSTTGKTVTLPYTPYDKNEASLKAIG